jgi:cell division transport system permease protein
VKLGFFLREAFRALKRNAVPSFAAMATVLVTVLILGVFIPVVQATTGAANEVRGRVIANVFLKTDASDRDVARVKNLLENETPNVASVEYVSKEEAYRAERRRDKQAYELLGANPLPDTFRVTPDKPDNISKVRNALSPIAPGGGRTVIDPAIDEVNNREEETNKILSITRVVKLTTAVLAALLVIASVLLIANTIRLSLYARRREVEVMKLVGALAVRDRGHAARGAGRHARGAAARRVQDRADRSARGRVRPDRGAGHDELRGADRRAAGRLDRRLGDGLRALAAPLPARLRRLIRC